MTTITSYIEQKQQICDNATPKPWASDDYIVNPGDTPGILHIFEAEEDDGPLLSTGSGTGADIRFCVDSRQFRHSELQALKVAVERLNEIGHLDYCQKKIWDYTHKCTCGHCKAIAKIKELLNQK